MYPRLLVVARVYEPDYGTLIGHVTLSHYCNHNPLKNKVLTITEPIMI